MNKYICLFAFSALMLFSSRAFAQQMNNDQLHKIIYTVSDTAVGQDGIWEFIIGNMLLMCITDKANNRMRIIAPIKTYEQLTPEEMHLAMEANFHSALDVRYALSEGMIWVAFIHPLQELTKEQTVDAISQVYSAAVTFGDSYTSTDLSFPKSEEEENKKRF